METDVDFEPQPLLFSLKPDSDESLVGFLIRLAEVNHLGSPYAVLKLAGAKPQQPPAIEDIPALAALCGCHPDQLLQLFGFVQKTQDGEKAWRIADQWITKPYFVSSRALSYCPECLVEQGYLRSIWELTLYRVCARHEVQLLDHCPSCGRTTTWMRSHVDRCHCGFLLRTAPRLKMDGAPLLVSTLMEQTLNTSLGIKGQRTLSAAMTRRLQELSLDGLCKTIWLLGTCLGDTKQRRIQCRMTPNKLGSALSIIEAAGIILKHWPDAFYGHLEQLRHRIIPTHDGALVARVFGSVHRHLTEDMTSDEFQFLRIAYERRVRDLWHAMSKTVPSSISTQLELVFGPERPR